jgi:hypothetical protein
MQINLSWLGIPLEKFRVTGDDRHPVSESKREQLHAGP